MWELVLTIALLIAQPTGGLKSGSVKAFYPDKYSTEAKCNAHKRSEIGRLTGSILPTLSGKTNAVIFRAVGECRIVKSE